MSSRNSSTSRDSYTGPTAASPPGSPSRSDFPSLDPIAPNPPQRGSVLRRVVPWLALFAFPAAMFALEVPLAHLGRYLAMGAGVALGLDRGLSLRRRWYARLGGLVFWFGFAGAAWWFLAPFTGGNLWSAWHETEELTRRLEALRPNDKAGFAADEERRDRLMREYPILRTRLREAEAAWRERTDQALKAFAAKLNVYRRQALQLIADSKFDEVPSVGERLWNDLRDEARSLWVLDDIRSLRDFCTLAGRAGDKARQAPQR